MRRWRAANAVTCSLTEDTLLESHMAERTFQRSKQGAVSMSTSDEEAIEVTGAKPLRELFPGYYPASKADRSDVYRRGLVSLDANALLDLYRFTKRSRDELFSVLEKLKPRLFVTHQAALEFHRDRLGVVEDRFRAPEKKCEEFAQPFQSVIEKIQEFANRHQIDSVSKQQLIDMVNGLSAKLTKSIMQMGAYDLAREEVKDGTDPVLVRVGSLLDGRVGDSLTQRDYADALKEAERRANFKIPPGYSDKGKPPERRAGDYLVWLQLINEAKIHGKPVLFVTDERKEDWMLKGSSNEVLGPRPELVLEMLREAGVALHTVSVVGLLTEAPEYLGATVSESTIQEAKSLPADRPVPVILSKRARQQYELLPQHERGKFEQSASQIAEQVRESGLPVISNRIKRLANSVGSYVLRWSPVGRAIFRINEESNGETSVWISQINSTQKAAHSIDLNIDDSHGQTLDVLSALG